MEIQRDRPITPAELAIVEREVIEQEAGYTCEDIDDLFEATLWVISSLRESWWKEIELSERVRELEQGIAEADRLLVNHECTLTGGYSTTRVRVSLNDVLHRKGSEGQG